MKLAAFVLNIISIISQVLTGIGLLIYGIVLVVLSSSGSDIILKMFQNDQTAADIAITIGLTVGIILIVIAIICFLTLIYMIPMTLKINKANKENSKVSLALSICTLIFVNPISGILLLVDTYM